ncbi:MAG: ABC transporter ATP-binding protein/permease [Salinibacterium sp.]|nr:ABC transporter ATP-binding protein/permease [Salinibacterium sp.]
MKLIWATLREFLPLMPAGARRFLVGYMVASSSITVLDVAALSLLAVIIGPIITGNPVALPVIGEMPASSTPWLILIACGLIISKDALSVGMHWVATTRFARYELLIGSRLFRAYIHSSWEERSKRSVAEITRIADAGIANAVAGFLLPLTTIPGSIATFVLILGVLVVADPLTSLIAFCYLTLVALVVYKVVTKRSLEAGQVNRDYSYRIAILMTEMVDALKELSLRNRLDQIANVVTENRRHSVRARRNGSFLAILPLYAFEAALIGGFLLIGGAAYLTSGIEGALASVALFAATGFRLIPAINALQGAIVQATASMPGAQDVIGDLRGAEANVATTSTPTDAAILPEEPRRLLFDNVRFRYPGASDDVLHGLTIDIPLGASLGIVGPSGAGKSTFIDLLLGLSSPTSGAITIDGLPLEQVIRAWRSRVGYVPQRVALFDATIAQNVALTWDDDLDRSRVAAALEKAQLTSLVDSRPLGMEERIGERGLSLSGGQQQRLGIARALYVNPLVLVLDEATSSLDTKTEDDVTQAIQNLAGEVTVIAVAHRLSTIMHFDRIAYLESGRIAGLGRFSELAHMVPAFGEQVALAGLAQQVQALSAEREREA